jgi:serine/threonine protein kinase
MVKRKHIAEVQKKTAVIDGSLCKIKGIEISRHISSGANGAVFEAFDLTLQRQCAVKIWFENVDKKLKPVREAQSIGRFFEECIAVAFRTGYVGGRYFLVMELVSGMPLREFLKQRNLSGLEKNELFRKITKPLSIIYGSGLLHGDPHANNFIVTSPRGLEGLDLIDIAKINVKAIDIGASWSGGKVAARAQREEVVLLELFMEVFSEFEITALGIQDRFESPQHALRWLRELEELIEYWCEGYHEIAAMWIFSMPICGLRVFWSVLSKYNPQNIKKGDVYLSIEHFIQKNKMRVIYSSDDLEGNRANEIEELFDDYRLSREASLRDPTWIDLARDDLGA